MFKASEGSTQRLLQLCLGYFFFYAIFGVATKYYTSRAEGFPAMSDLQFLVYSTAGGQLVCLGVVFAKRWFRLKTNRRVRVGPLEFPHEYLYIVPSGVCTAIVIPTTTILYMLLPSVMVAMVVMRASVIVISRIVDSLQIRSGILDKRVYWQEDGAIVFALLAVGAQLVLANDRESDLVKNTAAMVVLGAYVTAYFFRIYIMNYYKNTRPKGEKLDNEGFFAIEQIAAFVAIAIGTAGLLAAPSVLPSLPATVEKFRGAFLALHASWIGAGLAGCVFGLVAFFSVFIFMFKGRTATFAGLVNRLTSLIAGTTATVLFAVLFGGKMPKTHDWVALGLILVSVGFLTVAERRRAAELARA